MTRRRRWTRDELIVALELYCRTPFGRMHRSNPEIVRLAEALGRSPSSVAMKLCNFASLDPAERLRGIRGLRGASRADASIFEEYSTDLVSLARAGAEARARLGVEEVEEPEGDAPDTVGATEVERTVMARRVQWFFRASVLAAYDMTCAISGIGVPELLVASHIVPWSQDETRRLDPRNGIALSALHDRAFDRGLIALDDDLRVLVSARLRSRRPSSIHRVSLLEIEGQPLRPPTRFAPDPEAIRWHREHVFVG